MAELDQAILRTLAWFSLTRFPVTSFELWKWLLHADRPYSLTQVLEAVETSPDLQARIVRKDGFLFLKNEDADPVSQRRARFVDAVRKMKKARRACRWFARIPGVRAVYAANTLAWFHTDEQSDIDLFVIARQGNVWSTRFWMVLPFLLFRRRPNQRRPSRDPFCFSFFVSETHQDLSSVRIGNTDPYLAMWIHALTPLILPSAISMFPEHNAWTRTELPNAFTKAPHPYWCRRPAHPLLLQRPWLEAWLTRMQEKRFPPLIRSLMNKDTRVIINANMLKFHENDARAELLERWHLRGM
jgi:hypothetical protein